MRAIHRVLLLTLPVVLMAGLALAQEADHRPVLLDFYSDWCGPCRQMQPVVDSLAAEGFLVQRINIDEDRELCARYGVEKIPCFVVVEKGREVDRVVGPTSVERLKLKMRSRKKIVAPKPMPRQPVPAASQSPHPAWRYEQPVGFRSTVVRIYCQDGAKSRSIGSGTLVRWSDRVVVLTARHVVKDATKIVVQLCTRRVMDAKVVAVDATWDCAVLELNGDPGVDPADVERGEAAMQTAGARLESCGYGPDGKLACNSGLFLTYKRSSATPAGPDDWFTISGHARPGDSGGGVFDAQGKLVGVLWGTDGSEVICVQAGRLHLLLDKAVVAEQTAETEAIRERMPTPPKPAEACQGGCCNVDVAVTASKKGPALPWRKGTESRDDRQDARIEALIELQERQASAAGHPTPPEAQATPEPPKPVKENASPAVAGLCILLAIGLASTGYYVSSGAK